eukprot:12888684-Heterocapsa_arctica.AAC.1
MMLPGQLGPFDLGTFDPVAPITLPPHTQIYRGGGVSRTPPPTPRPFHSSTGDAWPNRPGGVGPHGAFWPNRP